MGTTGGKMKMKLKLAGVVAIATLAGMSLFGGQATAGTLQNGDFETVSPGNLPTDWTIAPGGDIFDLTGADYIPCCGTTGTPAELANHFASFGPGNVNNVSTLSQAFTTVNGASYTVSFDAGALGGGSQDLIASIYAVGGGTPLKTVTIDTVANNNLGLTFTLYSLVFTATSGNSYVAFNAVGQGNNIDPVLDNVSVSATPLPATWTMMLAGLAGLGFAGYRRAQKTAPALA